MHEVLWAVHLAMWTCQSIESQVCMAFDWCINRVPDVQNAIHQAATHYHSLAMWYFTLLNAQACKSITFDSNALHKMRLSIRPTHLSCIGAAFAARCFPAATTWLWNYKYGLHFTSNRGHSQLFLLQADWTRVWPMLCISVCWKHSIPPAYRSNAMCVTQLMFCKLY